MRNSDRLVYLFIMTVLTVTAIVMMMTLVCYRQCQVYANDVVHASTWEINNSGRCVIMKNSKWIDVSEYAYAKIHW